ncbi:hypothetical protein MTQ01_00995 [Streptomyces sp. XM4193]|uniref:anti-sigma factor family protein n=1 Tax=Streptomyces sp. XM4193 TaxID=2929782 RepID=UPI001FFB81A3|nr:hypothetical protein [Streptomyces sp. XM4193]MCK1794624.1 hypothetical protein [Streptomyces sp. XM4193]
MTEPFPTSGADEHPEVADISALGEGLLPPDRTAEVTAHLASCTLCADVRDSLEEIRSALGTLPGPIRMPEDVAGRIDAALAAEALLDAETRAESAATASSAPDRTPVGSTAVGSTAAAADPATDPGSAEPGSVRSGSAETDTAAPVSRETGKPAPLRERRGGASRRPPSRSGASAGPGRSSRRRRLILTSAAACAALVVGGLMVPLLMEDNDDSAGIAQSDTTKDGERGIAAADLDSQVRELLDASPHDTSREQPPSAEGSRNPGQPSRQEDSSASPFGAETATEVPDCVSKAIDRTETPLAVSRETYEGVESYVVVLPHEGEQRQVDAYVVGADCTDSADGGPGKVLAEQTVERP